MGYGINLGTVTGVGRGEDGKGELIVIAAAAVAVIVVLQIVAWVVGTVVTIVKLVALLAIVAVAIKLALRSSADS